MMGKRKKKDHDPNVDDERAEGESSDDTVEGGDREDASETEDAEDELTRTIREREEFREQLQRARADYQNQQHRLPKLVDEGVRLRLEPLLHDLLEVHDFLEMALASPAESSDAKNISIGVEMVRKRLLDTLGNFGVESIATERGSTFDPTQHEAVTTEASDDAEPGTVLAVTKRGFNWRDRVLRHAQVRVAEAPAEVTSSQDGGDSASDAGDDPGSPDRA